MSEPPFHSALPNCKIIIIVIDVLSFPLPPFDFFFGFWPLWIQHAVVCYVHYFLLAAAAAADATCCCCCCCRRPRQANRNGRTQERIYLLHCVQFKARSHYKYVMEQCEIAQRQMVLNHFTKSPQY